MAKVRDFRRMTADAPAAPTAPDTLDAASLSLLNDLQRDVQHAQGVFNRFAQGLAQKYQIGPKDTLDIMTGVITREVSGG